MARPDRLSVYYGDELVGTIHDTSPATFEYSPSWLERDERLTIAAVPLQPGRNDSPLVQSFYVESANFPSIPEIRNPKELQKIKYNGTFLVEWFPFAGRNQFDSIRFEVFDGQKIIWDTGDWNAAAPLAGSETETEVPSSVLVPGKEYRGVLRFERIPLFENGAPSAPGKRIGFWRETQFSLRRLPKLPPISETGEVCPSRVLISLPSLESHNLIVLS